MILRSFMEVISSFASFLPTCIPYLLIFKTTNFKVLSVLSYVDTQAEVTWCLLSSILQSSWEAK